MKYSAVVPKVHILISAVLIFVSADSFFAAPADRSERRKERQAARKVIRHKTKTTPEGMHKVASETTTRAADTLSSAGAAPRSFSFIHMSDIHVDSWTAMPENLSGARSYPCMRSIKDLQEVHMEPYGITAPRPSFFIATGDTSEYGFAGVTGQVVDRYAESLGLKPYFGTGNHDNTWVPPTDWFRKKYGGENYSFNFGGCHFIAINSASFQDPNPSFGAEVLHFVREDLRTIDNTTPVFLYCHHPLDGGEFCSRYDGERILDAVRAHNVVLFMVGHGHSARSFDFAGIPGVMGGSTFSKGSDRSEGFSIVNVQGSQLHVAYKRCNESSATKPLLNRTIPKRANYPSIITEVQSVGSHANREVVFNATISAAPGPVTSATYELDDVSSGLLVMEDATASMTLAGKTLTNGSHFVRFTFLDTDGNSFQRSARFEIDSGDPATTPTARWRFRMNGASRTTPLVHGGNVVVGSNDGTVYAINAKTGQQAWKFESGAEVCSSPAAMGDAIVFGDAGGRFHALTADGKSKWVYDAQLPVFCPAAVDTSGTIYFGTNDADLVALDGNTGRELWRNRDADYSIEAKPLAQDGKVYFGAWDGYLYCVDAASGRTDWKKPGTMNQKKVVRYYAPADATPVIAGGKLYQSDRGYYGGRYGLDGTFEAMVSEDVTAFGMAADGQGLYLRNAKTPVSKISLTGNVLWQSQLIAGRIPVAPIEHDGVVYVVTNSGELNALDAGTGSTKWTYQVTPQLYVMAGIAVDADTVYTTGQDGVVTAVRAPKGE